MTASTAPDSVVVWITGIPAAGKTTLALAVRDALRAQGRPAHCVDGDQLRATVSRDLGFERDARSENARRAAAVAVEHTTAGAIALVSLVSPFRADRDAARAQVTALGARFVEVHLDIPLQECSRRDPKGLYAAAAAGQIKDLTGYDAPYEPPLSPELHLAPAAGERAPVLADCVARVLAVVG
jgi:adenylyl-sulfate kinase